MYVISSGEGLVYNLDELTGALVVSHKLAVSSKDYPGRGIESSVTRFTLSIRLSIPIIMNYLLARLTVDIKHLRIEN